MRSQRVMVSELKKFLQEEIYDNGYQLISIVPVTLVHENHILLNVTEYLVFWNVRAR